MRRNIRLTWIKAFCIPAAIALAGPLTGCVTEGIPYSSGIPPMTVNPATQGPVSGVGIEGQDIVSMTDQMVRDMLANPTLAARTTPPRVVIDSRYFRNEGSQPINRDLITNRLLVELNRAAKGRMIFLTRNNINMVEKARNLKRSGVTDEGTTGLTNAIAGADYRLTGEIATLDERNVRTGMIERYNQITFEMIDLESGAIVWSGQYEFERAADDDVVYR